MGRSYAQFSVLMFELPRLKAELLGRGERSSTVDEARGSRSLSQIWVKFFFQRKYPIRWRSPPKVHSLHTLFTYKLAPSIHPSQIVI